MTKLKLKLKSFENELNNIKQNFTIIKIDYDSNNNYASITYTDGYVIMSVMYKYIEDINFWSISKIY